MKWRRSETFRKLKDFGQMKVKDGEIFCGGRRATTFLLERTVSLKKCNYVDILEG